MQMETQMPYPTFLCERFDQNLLNIRASLESIFWIQNSLIKNQSCKQFFLPLQFYQSLFFELLTCKMSQSIVMYRIIRVPVAHDGDYRSILKQNKEFENCKGRFFFIKIFNHHIKCQLYADSYHQFENYFITLKRGFLGNTGAKI